MPTGYPSRAPIASAKLCAASLSARKKLTTTSTGQTDRLRTLLLGGDDVDRCLVYVKGCSTTVFPWHDMEIRRSVVQQHNSPKPDYRYRLRRPGSPSVDLDAVAAGQRIQYGPFTVHLTGLTSGCADPPS